MLVDVFLRPTSQGPAAGRLWIGSFRAEHWDEAKDFARRNRSRGKVFTRLRKPRRVRH